MSTYTIVSYEPHWYESYLTFVKKNFSKQAYQGNLRYLEWLYLENPYGRGYQDFLLILFDEREVVGCIHKLRFECFNAALAGDKLAGVAIHNLMVDRAHRNGVGFLLVREILKKEQTFLVPGVVGELADTYHKLGARLLLAGWYSRLLFPRVNRMLPWLLKRSVTAKTIKECWQRISQNDVDLLLELDAGLIKTLQSASPEHILSVPYLEWRFFSPGFNTIVLIDRNTQSWLIMVVGRRKRLPVGRILFTKFYSCEAGIMLVRKSAELARALGCFMLLCTTTDNQFPAITSVTKLKKKARLPATYWYAKKTNLNDLEFWPLFSDIGLEETFS